TGNVALVGSSLASKNNLKVGSTFTAYNTSITVVGIFDAGNTFSNNQVIMPLATAQTLSGQAGDITSATVNVDSITNVNGVTSSVEKTLGSAADVTNAAATAQQTVAPLQNIQTISLYSLVGAVVAGAVIILLTMIMIVRERRREIGVLKAIGASSAKVMFQFMTEAVTLTVLGAVIGIGLGVAAGNPITKLLVNNSTSITASAPGGFGGGAVRRGFGGGFRNSLSSIHASVGWSIILYGFAAAIIIAVAGSAIASFFIAKVRPAEVMRAE
ncbi:MAG TPA: FtsX-like permease family protein, partial [Candidatus Dormibacteraeota bacterium]|nr:FtsX-like permease family protein [Candidatus Dormibacteraeota bacterium]